MGLQSLEIILANKHNLLRLQYLEIVQANKHNPTEHDFPLPDNFPHSFPNSVQAEKAYLCAKRSKKLIYLSFAEVNDLGKNTKVTIHSHTRFLTYNINNKKN